MNKSVRPTVCDVEADAGEEDEWMNRWMKPFVPEEEEMGNGEGGGEEREGDEEETVEDSEEGETEEARKPKAARVPTRPSQEEVDEHMITHLPFRSWCPHCIRGKSKGKPHKKPNQGNREIPTVALDYTFMYDTQNEGEEKGMPILVMKDIRQDEVGTGMLFAQVVPAKRVQPYVVKTCQGNSAIGPPRGHP